MKQVLAALVAIALIGGAWFVRTEFIEGEGDPGTADGPADQPDGDDDVAGEVVCDARLGDACPAGATAMDADAIVGAFRSTDGRPDVLIAPDLVVEMVRGSLTGTDPFGEPAPLATSLLTLVTFTGGQRAAAQDTCGAQPTWGCVADGIGVDAADFNLGLHDPSSDSDGIAAFGALTAGFLSDRDLPVNNNGLSATNDFLTWLGGVQDVARTGRAPVEEIVLRNGAQTNAAVVTEAEALPVVDSPGAAGRLTVRYPTPLVAITVVAVGVDGADVGGAADAVADALTAAGWRPADGSPPDGAPALPDDRGLPSGGFLVSLQSRW